VCFWANLQLNNKNENEPAVKPFNKRKGKSIKSEAAVGNALEQENDTFGKIDEFNLDTWSVKTNDWIKGALDKGFDSMAIMQPLIDEAQQVARRSSLHSNHAKTAVVDAVGPSSQSRCKIVEGAVSDSDADSN
jgi:hypothetical protein